MCYNVFTMNAQTFGPYLRELRKAKGYSLRELGEIVDMDYTYLSKVETGKFPPPSEDAIRRLAEALNAEVDQLLSLAEKVASEVQEYIRTHPHAPKLLRALKSGHLREAKRMFSKLEEETRDAD